MKVGDLIKFKGSWYEANGPEIGVVTGTWTNGRTKRLTSVDVLWDNGKLGNVLVINPTIEVINESR
mgnify:CR=1 FL=1